MQILSPQKLHCQVLIISKTKASVKLDPFFFLQPCFLLWDDFLDDCLLPLSLLYNHLLLLLCSFLIFLLPIVTLLTIQQVRIRKPAKIRLTTLLNLLLTITFILFTLGCL